MNDAAVMGRLSLGGLCYYSGGFLLTQLSHWSLRGPSTPPAPHVCMFVSAGSEPPGSPQVVEDGGEEDEEELSGGEEGDLRSSSGRGSLLTRRGITLRVLLKDGLVEPGDGVLGIHYLVITRPVRRTEEVQGSVAET